MSAIMNGEYDALLSLGGLTAEDVMSGKYDLSPIDDAAVELINQRIDDTRVLEYLAEWEHADNLANGRGIGGRPAAVNFRAVIVGFSLLSMRKQALHIRLLSLLLMHRLSPHARELLGLAEPKLNLQTAASQNLPDQLKKLRAEEKRWENNTTTAFHRLLALVDPYPVSLYETKSAHETAAILATVDEDHAREMRQRLNLFSQLFCEMTFRLMPEEWRSRITQTDLSIDQTYIQSPNRKLFSRKRLPAKLEREERRAERGEAQTPFIVDPFTGGYALGLGERPDAAPGSTPEDDFAKGSGTKQGWALNVATAVDSLTPDSPRIPKVVRAFSVSIPNLAAAEETVALMQLLRSFGHPGGVIDGDQNYFALSDVDRLHEPTRQLGFVPSFDYRDFNIGTLPGRSGEKWLHGYAYCPATPKHLLDSAVEYMAGRTDEDTFNARYNTLRSFRLRQKEKPDHNGNAPYMCPALGKSSTLTCPLREVPDDATDKPRHAVKKRDLPAIPGKVCQRTSITLTPDDGLRERQAFDYGTKEWHTFHRHARQRVESLNKELKDSSQENIEDAGRRPTRGIAAAQFFMTIAVVSYNIRKIATAWSNAQLDLPFETPNTTLTPEPTRQPKAKPRKRERMYNPYTGRVPDGFKKPTDIPEHRREKTARRRLEKIESVLTE